MEKLFDLKVYYEDTDCMGVVYHANYLRFMERARTELLNALGPSVSEWTERGYIFPIYNVNVTFKAPARLGDALRVITRARQSSPFRITFEQRIERRPDGQLLVHATAETVCTDLQGTLCEYPDLSIPKDL